MKFPRIAEDMAKLKPNDTCVLISGLLFKVESPSKLILLGTAGQAELSFNGTQWVLYTRSLQYGPLEFPFPSRAEAIDTIIAAMEFAENGQS